MLAAFQQYGLQPGPLLFASRPDLVWTLVASLYIGNVMLLVLNLPLVGMWARVMLVPRPMLFGGHSRARLGRRVQPESIAARSRAAVRRRRRRLRMRIYGISRSCRGARPRARPLAELQFRRALAISEGDVVLSRVRSAP
jgi:putative tricarboxylic transport membrane protein